MRLVRSWQHASQNEVSQVRDTKVDHRRLILEDKVEEEGKLAI